jgi:type I restriction enzyme S subunit
MAKVKIGDFLKRIKRPITLDPNNEYKLVTVKLHHKGVVLRGIKKGVEIKSKMYQIKEGDFILSGIDARNGAFGIVPKELNDAIVTNDFWYFELDEEIIDKHFFLELTTTSWFDDICRLGSDGTTQRIRLQKDKFFNQAIDLPPLREQQKFIDKFKQLKSINTNLYEEIQTQQTLLKKLRQSILQEAIEGKLTAEWRAEHPDVEPASILLEKIRAEKERLVKEKKIKKQKPLPPISDEEKPFEIPATWEWCRLGDYSINKDENRIPVSKADREKREKIYDYYGASGVIDKIDGYTHEGTFLLIGEDGANLVTRNIPVAFIASGKFWVNNHAHILEFLDLNSLKYIEKYINAIDLKPYITGGFQPKLSQANLSKIKVAIPPIEEQKEIVKKIESLFKICDALEEQIEQSKADSEMLMQAILREAFEG